MGENALLPVGYASSLVSLSVGHDISLLGIPWRQTWLLLITREILENNRTYKQ